MTRKIIENPSKRMIDSKYRINLPASIKETYIGQENYIEKGVLIPKEDLKKSEEDNFIPETYLNILKIFSKKELSTDELKTLEKRLNDPTHIWPINQIKIDNHGRLVLPEHHRNYAEITENSLFYYEKNNQIILFSNKQKNIFDKIHETYKKTIYLGL